MTAPDMTAPTVRPVVGGVYGDRTGRQRGPMFLSAALLHPFRAPGEFYFTAEGFADGNQVRSIHDLITVVSEPGRGDQPEATPNQIVEHIAAWIESQRADIPACGWEFAAAIRQNASDLATLKDGVVSEPGRDAQDEDKGEAVTSTVSAVHIQRGRGERFTVSIGEDGITICDETSCCEVDMIPLDVARAIGEALIRITEGAE